MWILRSNEGRSLLLATGSGDQPAKYTVGRDDPTVHSAWRPKQTGRRTCFQKIVRVRFTR